MVSPDASSPHQSSAGFSASSQSLPVPAFFFFFCFLGPHLWHMEFPRLGVECRPTPQPQQCQIPAVSGPTAQLTAMPDPLLAAEQGQGSNPQTHGFLSDFFRYATLGTPSSFWLETCPTPSPQGPVSSPDLGLDTLLLAPVEFCNSFLLPLLPHYFQSRQTIPLVTLSYRFLRGGSHLSDIISFNPVTT